MSLPRLLDTVEIKDNGGGTGELPLLALLMIVKEDDESVVRQALDSVSAFVDFWVVADNGSTPEVRQLFLDYFEERQVPGELWEDEWSGFAATRSRALDLCAGKAQWALMLDADDVLHAEGNPFAVLRDMQDHDQVMLRLKTSQWSYLRGDLFRVSPEQNWMYKGVAHNYACRKPGTRALQSGTELQGCWVESRRLGSRNADPEKYLKDARLFEAELAKDPNDTRSQFYYAQSLKDAGKTVEAAEAYEKRLHMRGGFYEEAGYAGVMAGRLFAGLGHDARAVNCWTEGVQRQPNRLATYWNLTKHFAKANKHREAAEWARKGFDQLTKQRAGTVPRCSLFQEDWLANWGLEDELSLRLYYWGINGDGGQGPVREAVALLQHVMDRESKNVDERTRKRWIQNMEYFTKAAKTTNVNTQAAVKPVPVMTDARFAVLSDGLEEMNDKKAQRLHVFEYGSGQSTVMLAQHPRVAHVHSVESNMLLASHMACQHPTLLYFWNTREEEQAAANKPCCLERVDLKCVPNTFGTPGPGCTEEAKRAYYTAFPRYVQQEERVPHLLFIDGRFRVACALHAFSAIPDPSATLVVIDDFEQRPAYYVVLAFYDLVRLVHGMAVLRKKARADPPHPMLLHKFEQTPY